MAENKTETTEDTKTINCINIDELKITYTDISEKIDFTDLDEAIESICDDSTEQPTKTN